MTVAELEALLATLDGDTVVLVRGVHIDYISKNGATRWPLTVNRRPCNDCGNGTVNEDEMRDVPPSIDICSTIWWTSRAAEAPKVRLTGRWSRAAKALMTSTPGDVER